MFDEMDRREFVRFGMCVGVGLATVSATGCGLKEAETQVETPEWEFGEETEMGKRVLAAYATKNGSTAGVAEAIGRALAERGFEVDVKPVATSPAPDGYDAVIVGSAVNGGAWLPEGLQYVERHAAQLGTLPVAAFVVHGMNAGDGKEKTKRLAYLDGVRKLVKLSDEGYFLGKMDEMGTVARFAFKAFGGAGEGDMRNWDKISAWAKEVRI